MKPEERRIKLIEKLLEENYEVLTQYDRQLTLENDPRERLKIQENIEWVKKRNAELEQQLDEIQRKIDAQNQNGKSEAELFTALTGINQETPLERHYNNVVSLFKQGRVIAVLGTGVNLYGRPAGSKWEYGQFLPTPKELALELAEAFGYPENDSDDLARVSQFVATVNRPGPLYDRLRQLYEAEYPPTFLHEFFASLPPILRNKVNAPRYPIIVTTNYDDLLERAFDELGEPYDLLSYAAEGENRHKFLHLPPAGQDWIPIDDPNRYLGIQPTQRPVILKMHGALDRFNSGQDNLVVTEDQFINYMARTEISKLIPATVMRELRNSSLLFMGYKLSDWSLRVILHRVWGERERRLNDYDSWAIDPAPDELDQKFWKKWDVEVVPVRLEDYISSLSERLQNLAPSGVRR
jgi:hypothetical protein